MGDWLADLGLFIVQAVIFVILAGIVLALVLRRQRGESHTARKLQVEPLHRRRRQRRRRLALATLSPAARKRQIKAFRREDKREKKSAAPEGENTNGAAGRVWVLDFHGDIKASGTQAFAEEISAVLDVAKPDDEVVVRLESPGGLVHAYGLAAAQMDRLRAAALKTTVCVDKVAASGGYMMACSAERIVAAPFAVIGSIGVVAQVPNVHRLLKRHDVDVELLTAGKYKRTLTVLGENTEEGRVKFVEDLENTHRLFKAYVGERRPALDIERIATGEIWYGSEALGEQLIDEVSTSEAYLNRRMDESEVFSVRLEPRKGMGQRLGRAISAGVEHAVTRAVDVADATRWLQR